MTIDILRCTNPALSLTEEGFPAGALLYGKPSPEELVLPQDAARKREEDIMSRSKSAPPTESNEPPSGGRNSPRANQIRTSYSYDKRREGGYLVRNYRYVPSRSFIDLVEYGGSASSASTIERDPDGQLCNPDFHVLRIFAPGPAGACQQVYGTENGEKAVSGATQNEGSRTITATTDLDLIKPTPLPEPLQVQPPLYKGNASHQGDQHSSSFASSQSPVKNNYNEGGVLVLRPNPVKTVPPISQQVAGGVVATAPRLVPTPTLGVAHPDPQEGPPQSHVIYAPVVTETRKTQPTIVSDPWSKKASEKARKQKGLEKEKLRLAEIRRRQEQQCNFPNSFSNMPPASGRASAEIDLDGSEDHETASANRFGPGENGSRQQQHSNRMIHSRAFRSTGDDGDEESSRNIQSTPVFERLVTDEVRELQTYARMVESQNTELEKMRRYQMDLEQRLQEESVQHEQLEATLEAREREWLLTFEDLELEIKRLNGVVKAEESKNRLLLDQIRKKDQDIQGMLKKKYDNEGPNPRPARGYKSTQLPEHRSDRMIHSTSRGGSPGEMMHRSPDDYLRLLGSSEKVRERNTRHLLMDFFGM